MYNASLENQYVIQTPNRVGAASELTDVISNKAKANIRSIFGSETGKSGHFYVIADKGTQLVDYLKKNGFSDVREQEVLVIQTPDERGSCAEVTQRLAKAGINIESFWTTSIDKKTAIVLSTDNNKKAQSLFN